MSRQVPTVIHHPYAVFSSAGVRLGLVDRPEQIAKLLAGDPHAGILRSRRGYVVIEDVDSWLCLPREFKLRDYMSASTVVRRRTDEGRMYYDIRAGRPYLASDVFLRILDSRRPRKRKQAVQQPRPAL